MFDWAGAVIKADHTEPGIADGVVAGGITVGLTLSGNEAGLTTEELAVLSPNERMALHERGGDKLKAAGAYSVIETVADLPQFIDMLERRGPYLQPLDFMLSRLPTSKG